MELINFPKRKPMPCPFGGGNDANITPIEMVSSQNVNFYDGFPSVYGAPSANNGKFVTRKEMNAIGNLASNDLFYHKCGGLNTFDPEFALKIGGYAKGAVLQALIGNDIVYIRSLVDNNMVDFTGTSTQAQVNAGIINGGIDGVNWVTCNTDLSRTEFVLFSLPDQIPASINGTLTTLNTFQATANGYVVVKGGAVPTVWQGGTVQFSPYAYFLFRESTNGTTWGDTQYFYKIGPGFLNPEPSINVFRITRGHYYTVLMHVCQNGGASAPPSGLAYTDVTLRGILAT